MESFIPPTLNNNSGTLKLKFSNFSSQLDDINMSIPTQQTTERQYPEEIQSLNNVDCKLDSMYVCKEQAKIELLSEPNSYPFEKRTIMLTPNIKCKVGRLIAKGGSLTSNAIFDCKVLSRNHAMLWYCNRGKFWIQDMKSCNGTYVNDNKLGSDPVELHFGNVVKFGVEVMDNSHMQVCGSIVACVQLYLPDGRKASSVDANAERNNTQTQCNSEQMQPKLLYVNATQSTTGGDEKLFQRIESLEHKLEQALQSNTKESELKKQIAKLLAEKETYELTTNEALRKSNDERFSVIEMLKKQKEDFAVSERECKKLLDQVIISKDSLNNVNARLVNLETEYDSMKKQKTFEEQYEKHIADLTQKLHARTMECADLRSHMEQLSKRSELLEQENQTLTKLNAAFKNTVVKEGSSSLIDVDCNEADKKTFDAQMIDKEETNEDVLNAKKSSFSNDNAATLVNQLKDDTHDTENKLAEAGKSVNVNDQDCVGLELLKKGKVLEANMSTLHEACNGNYESLKQQQQQGAGDQMAPAKSCSQIIFPSHPQQIPKKCTIQTLEAVDSQQSPSLAKINEINNVEYNAGNKVRVEAAEYQQKIGNDIRVCQDKMMQLPKKRIQTGNIAQNDVEKIQIPFEESRNKASEREMLVDALTHEKEPFVLGQGMNINNNISTLKQIEDNMNESISESSSDTDISIIHVTDARKKIATTASSERVKRTNQKEIFIFGEQLKQAQHDKDQLRQEIVELKMKAETKPMDLFWQILPYGIIIVLMWLGFLCIYFKQR